jgi:thymidylate synthase
MNNLDKQYTDLLQDILINGVVKSDRTGTGTISIFGRQIRHKMSEGFPLLTTKKMPFKTIVTELLWFLKGDTNIKYLVDNGCHIWDGDCYQAYLRECDKIVKSHSFSGEPERFTQEEFIDKIKNDKEFCNRFGNLGPIYGKQWRRWNKVNFDNMIVDYSGDNTGYTLHEPIDQIQNLINDLKTNPDSRRLMVNTWNVGELDQMVLPPCHYGFQVYTRELSLDKRYELAGIFGKEKLPGEPSYTEEQQHSLLDELVPKRAISLMWNQRSVDTFLGLPFNIASYGLLLEIIAKAVNMVPDELIGNLGDVHLYSNHVEQAKEQIGREFDELERMELGRKKGLWKEFQFGNIHLTCDEHNIPKRTREPYPLPTLKHMKTEAFYKSLSEDVSLVTHLDNTDFVIENYQSHPSIKAPLSN